MNQKQISESYRRLFKKFGFGPKSLKWRNEKASVKRFNALISDIDFEGKTILDVGCGFGNIISFIDNKTKNFTYTGTDIIPEFINEAKKLHSKHKFGILDFTKDKIDKNYDIILASGCLNSNRSNNLEFRKKIIKKLFMKADYVLAFNMAGDFPQPDNKKENNVWYANSMEILQFCFSLTNKVIFKIGYAYKDFTIVMSKY